MAKISLWLDDLLDLFYPRLCASCGNKLVQQEIYICTRCLFHLPKTNFHLHKNNPVARIFWGRVPLEYATAFFEFQKGSPFQKLLHKMKYQNQKEIGWVLGKHFGTILKDSSMGKWADMLVPVPLHPLKERKRGYNQSYWIAKGMAESMEKDVVTGNLYRAINTSTQTQKGRYERWKNMENSFKLHHPLEFSNRHILLIDDVVTTGSTLEACAQTLRNADYAQVSIATLAYA